MERDLKLAEQVQKRFLPQSVPSVPGFEFFAHYHPAYEVGGDYYDFVRLSDTRFCILTQDSPGHAANELNRLLYAAGIEEKFITLSLSVLDATSRKLTL